MPQSPELAGGEGFTYEGDVAALYLTALLAEAHAPGIDDRTVVGVSVQQRDFGEPLDDVIVDFASATAGVARLSLQVKRSLVISAAQTNTDFRDVVRDSWATLNKPDFRSHVDRYGVATGSVAQAKARALKTLCDWARESQTTQHFEARFAAGGNASGDIKTVKQDITALLKLANGVASTAQEVHRFLAHFVLIEFDFLHEGATAPADTINRIQSCLAPEDGAKAPLVWSRFVQLARASAGRAGQFDRPRLVRTTSSVARLRGAPSLRAALDTVTALAHSAIRLIADDVGGTRLERATLLEALRHQLTQARVVQVRGLPGSGKSVVIRRAVQHALASGPVLFLRAEQLEGASWNAFATLLGMPGIPLEHLLVEVSATGTPLLFIDGIDRIEKEHQPIIVELLHALATNPLLESWRVAVSLRDTGIDMLRNWLGDVLDQLRVATVKVEALNDEEARALAEAKPHLRPLLFGQGAVRAIVRRPFFAKVLNQGYVADPATSTFAPQSEVDLIEHWWRRGGYNADGQHGIERQRALIDLARVRARQLSQPIGLRQLSSTNHIHDLKSDGILQSAREGLSIRFAHDIFFEWSYFYVLAERENQWVDEIKACGEPPALGRVVELLSQWEYREGSTWRTSLSLTEASGLRTQWLRAWLLGPLGAAQFPLDEEQFATAAFDDDFRLFRKVLVWFQAEKTTPNVLILSGALPAEQRERMADLFSWPSDFTAWERLISFILRRVHIVPPTLFPDIAAIFGVWQNVLADLPNPTSEAILQQSALWLASLDAIRVANQPDDNYVYWEVVPERGSFQRMLRALLLRAARAEPDLAAGYLRRATETGTRRIDDTEFQDVLIFSPTLARTLPSALVDLSLSFLRRELPDDRVAREREERQRAAEWRQALQAKPESERTRQEQRALSMGQFLHGIGDFHDSEWDRLAIDDNHLYFSPPSPLREPFHALFEAMPEEGLRLLRELCNHAMTAWRQLHKYSYQQGGTPLPLTLTFPWGVQRFWGTDREYLWCRATWAPEVIGCGFLALEEWCLNELAAGRPADELIQQIVEGNECIAILGVASMITLHAERVSETTLPLVTSQRLIGADERRMHQDLHPSNLIGFSGSSDRSHVAAVKAANERSIRTHTLRRHVPAFILPGGAIAERVREAIEAFKSALPYQYEEERDVEEVRSRLAAQAREFAELVDLHNYQTYRVQDDPNRVAVVHVSPSASSPESVARADAAALWLKRSGLWMWANQSLEEHAVNGARSIEEAIAVAREADDSDALFADEGEERAEDDLGSVRGAVAGTAAVVLRFREGRAPDELDWAREVLGRAIQLKDPPDPMRVPNASIPWHHAIFVARGLGADLRAGTAAPGAARNLLSLVTHPLEMVALAAVDEACALWPTAPRLTWAALTLALSLCKLPARARHLPNDEVLPEPSDVQADIERALTFADGADAWTALPLPPPAWVRANPGDHRRRSPAYGSSREHDAFDAAEVWVEPNIAWRSQFAAKILERMPFQQLLESDAKTALLDYLSGVLDWTIQKNAPSWVRPGERDRLATAIYEWTATLGACLGRVAGLLPLLEVHDRFLDPVLRLEGENCWILLSPFVSTYVRVYVYNAPAVPSDAMALLDQCLGRLLQDRAFQRGGYRSGQLSGSWQPRLVHTLFFVDVEHAGWGSRYVNGDWSDISLILPLVDRFIRAAGWSLAVIEAFLMLCERAKEAYPANTFAEQILALMHSEPNSLEEWRSTIIPARVAELVQHFAHREAPMQLTLAQKSLRILDTLVDMGDRRSAALQLAEAFREVRLAS